MHPLPSPASLFDLTGRSALITGATGALGRTAARALAGAGAHVTLAGANEEKLGQLAAELRSQDVSVACAVGRPTDEEATDAIVAKAVETGGRLDILVAASGKSVVRPILDMDVATWDSVMDANVRQIWLLCRSAGRVLVEQGTGGKLILVSSVRARFATAAGTSAYGPSKAAIDMLVRSLAMEWGPQSIHVNAIAPTLFRSDLTAWLFTEEGRAARENALSRIPLGRLGEPDDFAGVLLFLASKAADLVTGEIINVDGGFSCN